MLFGGLGQLGKLQAEIIVTLLLSLILSLSHLDDKLPISENGKNGARMFRQLAVLSTEYLFISRASKKALSRHWAIANIIPVRVVGLGF